MTFTGTARYTSDPRICGSISSVAVLVKGLPTRVQVVPDSSGCGVPRAHTPLKRSRADVQQRISGDLARTGRESPVDEVVDHVRAQKRFVSEVRPRDL